MANTDAQDLIDTLQRHRQFLLQTAEGLSEAQARERSTVSALTIAGILKHVADTEEQWAAFAQRGPEAFGQIYNEDIDWEAVSEASEAGESWEDPRFDVTESDTLPLLRERIVEVGAATSALLSTANLDTAQPLPEAPWFEPGASWSVRRVALHLLAEISQHAGHADIIREAIDGQRTMG